MPPGFWGIKWTELSFMIIGFQPSSVSVALNVSNFVLILESWVPFENFRYSFILIAKGWWKKWDEMRWNVKNLFYDYTHTHTHTPKQKPPQTFQFVWKPLVNSVKLAAQGHFNLTPSIFKLSVVCGRWDSELSARKQFLC